MTLPLFRPEDDPGPELPRRAAPGLGQDPFAPVPAAAAPTPFESRHGTTIVAIRYADGVVMAGDRRATAGSSIAHRAMEKVHPADRHSGVAIAGAAGPAMEMVRLFQLQLEHYEKVEGRRVSLEGKANQLSQMVKANLAMAMQGFVVVPLFAGYDTPPAAGADLHLRPDRGPLRGDRLPRRRSGGRDARTTIKLGWQRGHDRERRHRAGGPGAVRGGRRGLGDGRPRHRPGHLPDGGRPSPPTGFERCPRAEVAERFAAVIAGRAAGGLQPMSMPFYVAPEQFMKDKADFARKNIARGRPLVATVYADGILICAENASKTLHKVSEIYDRIAFAGVGRYNEFDQLRRSGVQHADIKGYQFSREDVDARSLANLYAQYIGNIFTHEMKPLEVEILVAEVGAEPAGDQLFHILYDGSVVDEDRFSGARREAEAITARMAKALPAGLDLGPALKAAAAALGGPTRPLAVPDLEVAVLARSKSRRAFRRIADGETAELLAEPPEPAAAAAPRRPRRRRPRGHRTGRPRPSHRSPSHLRPSRPPARSGRGRPGVT